jgi:hypothetical protein
VPIFTTRGKGLDYTKAPERNTYMSVRGTGPFARKNNLLPVLEVAEWNIEARSLHPKLVMMFHGPGYHQEALPFENVGRLLSTSTATLMAYYNVEKGDIMPNPSGISITKYEVKTRDAVAAQLKAREAF